MSIDENADLVAELPEAAEPTPVLRVEDRRFWARGEQSTDAEGQDFRLRQPTYVEELQAQIEQLRRRLDETRAGVQRIEREADQSRQRLLRDLESRAQRKTAALLAPVLEAMDGLDLALRNARSAPDLDGLIGGLELVRTQLAARLADLSLERIATVGLEFDPTVHEAVGTVPVAETEQIDRVVEEVQAGFRLGETLIRPARVMVGVAG